jgi:hypothetical protein
MILSDELANDPLTRGYAGMTDVQAAADLNTVYRTRYRLLPTRDLLRWGFAREGLSKLADAANREGTFAGISDTNRAKAISAYAIMTQGIDGSLDLDDPEVDSLIDELITAGIFVAQDKTDLQTRATENVSRATELGLSRVREGTVAQARAQ